MISIKQLIISASAIFCFSIKVSFGQFGYFNQSDLDILKASTTVVIIHSDSNEYNKNIIAGMNRFWTYNKFIFATPDQAHNYLEDPRYSFLMTIAQIHGVNDTPHDKLMLAINKQKPGGSFNNLDPIVWIELYSIYNHRAYDFCMMNLIQNIHNNLVPVDKNTISDLGSSARRKIYNSNTSSLKTKTLYINAGAYLNGEKTFSIDEISSIYPYEIKIVWEEEITEAIANQDENIAYFFIPEGSAGKAVYIINAKGGEFIYCSIYPLFKREAALNKSSLKNLVTHMEE